MVNSLYLGNCRHFKSTDDIINFSDSTRSNCKRCVYFSSFNCGVPQVQNSIGEFLGGLF